MNNQENKKKRKIFINYNGVGFVNSPEKKKIKLKTNYKKKNNDICIEKQIDEIINNIKELHIR
jgi:hypothetical protein